MNKLHLCVSTWNKGVMACGLTARHNTIAMKNRKNFVKIKPERLCTRCLKKVTQH